MELNDFIHNLFGMSIEKQIELIEEIKNSMKTNNKTNRIFNKMFDNYYSKIKLLEKNKELYNQLNSNQRRLLRLKTLKNLEEKAEDHSKDNSDINRQRAYIYRYSSEYYIGYYVDEFNSYFHPKKISNKDSNNYINKFKNMSINEKYNMIKEYIYQYTNLDDFFYWDIPNPNELINEYNPIILNIIGQELFEYYQKLHNREKISIITEIANMIEEIESYDKKSLNIKDKDAVKKQKVLTLKNCNYYLNK